MKRFFLLTACAALLSLGTQAQTPQADYQVVPLPQVITAQKGTPFVLTSGRTISCASADPDLRRQAEFLRDYVKEFTGIELSIVDKKGDIQLFLSPKVQSNEGYTINVSSKRVAISGKTTAGVFYGIQTLRKSLQPNVKRIELPATIITDAPRFGYRGMMLDCGRHYFPISFVKRFIDLLALHNMNTFHWHLTEDQGWRLEIKKYPRLTSVGSIREMTVVGRNSGVYDSIPYGGFYTQDEAREIVRYAAERHITVIPEIDMPGHMQGALAAYPDMGCTGGPYKVWPLWGVSDDVLCLGNEKIYQFCQDVLTEVMDIFPSKLIHLGGDETPHTRWENCPRCKALAQREGVDVRHLQNVFTHRMEEWVESKGRHIIGWDEVLQSDNLSPNTVVMSWRGAGPGAEAARKGHNVIMSPNSYNYFDYYQTAAGESKDNEPLLIGGNLPIETTYSFEPVEKGASAETASHIIGVQANLWTEYIPYPSLAEYQVLPRMGALAEVQWMAPEKNFEQFKQRSQTLRRFYDFYHLTYNKRLWREAKK